MALITASAGIVTAATYYFRAMKKRKVNENTVGGGAATTVIARFIAESGDAVRVTQRSDNHVNLLGTLNGQRALLLVSQKPFARAMDGAKNGEAPPDGLVAFLQQQCRGERCSDEIAAAVEQAGGDHDEL